MPMISNGIRRFFFRPVLPAFIVAVLTIGSPFSKDLFAPEDRKISVRWVFHFITTQHERLMNGP